MMLALLVALCVASASAAPTATERKSELKQSAVEAVSYDALLTQVKKMEARVVAQKEVGTATAVTDAVVERRKALHKRKSECATLAKDSDKKSCLDQVHHELLRNEEEAKLVATLRKCETDHVSDAKARAKCVEDVSIKFLQMRPKGLEAKLATDAEKVSAKAMAHIEQGREDGATLVKEAMRDLNLRAKAIRARAKECNALLEHRELRACRTDVRAQIARAREGVATLKKLSRCGTVFATDSNKRARCVRLLGARLRRFVSDSDHQIDNHYPKTLEDLGVVETRASESLKQLLVKLATERKECTNHACIRSVTRRLVVAHRLRTQLDSKFRPRRVCLMERHKFRTAEFATRAQEHEQLARKHRAALACHDGECVAVQSREERQLAAEIEHLRALRKRRWNALKCPPVGDIDQEDAMTPQEAHEHRLRGRYSRRASLHLKLNRAYGELRDCTSDECTTRMQARVTELEHLLSLLEKSEGLDRAKRRHTRRAQLHERLTVLYKRAAACTTEACRRVTQRQLRRIKRALAEIQRTFLAQDKLDSEQAEADRQRHEERERKERELREAAAKAQRERRVREEHELELAEKDAKLEASKWLEQDKVDEEAMAKDMARHLHERAEAARKERARLDAAYHHVTEWGKTLKAVAEERHEERHHEEHHREELHLSAKHVEATHITPSLLAHQASPLPATSAAAGDYHDVPVTAAPKPPREYGFGVRIPASLQMEGAGDATKAQPAADDAKSMDDVKPTEAKPAAPATQAKPAAPAADVKPTSAPAKPAASAAAAPASRAGGATADVDEVPVRPVRPIRDAVLRKRAPTAQEAHAAVERELGVSGMPADLAARYRRAMQAEHAPSHLEQALHELGSQLNPAEKARYIEDLKLSRDAQRATPIERQASRVESMLRESAPVVHNKEQELQAHIAYAHEAIAADAAAGMGEQLSLPALMRRRTLVSAENAEVEVDPLARPAAPSKAVLPTPKQQAAGALADFGVDK